MTDSAFLWSIACLVDEQDREELFAFPINWQIVESHNIIQSKMRPWIVKKIIEYLGEEEKTLTEFILTKLGQRAPPQARGGLWVGVGAVFWSVCS